LANPVERQGLTATIFGANGAKDPDREAHTMTMTLSDNLSVASTGANTGSLEFKTEATPIHDGLSFGQFMSEMLPLQTDSPAATDQAPSELRESLGQQIADPLAFAAPGAVLDTAAWPLKAVNLGPHLNVITANTKAPDTQSLEAFARAQGLDEQAVSWLFGGNPSSALNAPTPIAPAPIATGAMNNVGGISAVGGFSAADGGFAAIGSAVLKPGSALAGASTQAMAPDGEAVNAAKAAANTTNASPLGGPIQVAQPTDATDSVPSSLANGAAQGQPPSAAAALLGSALTGVQALWAMADDPGKPAKTSASAITSTEEALPIQMLRMPPPAAVWMQRGIMNSVLQDNVSAQKEALISTSELDLGADWGGDTLQQLLGTEGGSSGSSSTGTHGSAYANFASRWDAQAASRNDLTNANGPAQDLPDTHARSENIQNLADKMGQAVGQRILSEMEKGQWHLKLQLRPATLGHIEVEMRMRSGEFDAVFTAPNATTRDLLQDGMGKLRETLAQMGMDVANIHVGNGQTGQSGGDSTPGTPKGKTAQVEASAPDSSAEIPRAPRVKDPRDGLDVLV
jgi:hypothetical protein